MNANALLTAASLGLVALSTAVVFFACDGTDLPPQSDEYGVEALYVSARAQSNGLQVLVTASLAAEGVGIELGAGDELYVEDATGASRRLGDTGTGYAALLDSSSRDLELVLKRDSGEVRGVLALPEPFALLLSVSESDLGSTLELSWDAGTEDALVGFLIYGDCLPSPFQRGGLSDTGGYTIQPGELQIDPNISPCTLSVELYRDGGLTAPGFGDSTARWAGSQVRTAAIEVAP